MSKVERLRNDLLLEQISMIEVDGPRFRIKHANGAGLWISMRELEELAAQCRQAYEASAGKAALLKHLDRSQGRKR